MAKEIDNEEDVQGSLDSFERSGSNVLKIPEGKTPIYLLSGEYQDGYVHWVNIAGNITRVVCLGGVEGRGWAPDECPICKYVAEMYGKAKKLEESHGKEDKRVKALRKKAGRLRAKYEAHFVAAKGELVREKTGSGKKRFVPDFEDCDVGILSCTKQQFEDLTSIRKSEKYPFMNGGKDLLNRPIVVDKRKRGDSIYATSEFIPSKRTSDLDVDYDEDELGLDSDFEIDEESAEAVVELLQKPAESTDEDDVEFEKADSADIDDDFLDDVDDDFEDDIPTEDDVKAKKKSKSKKHR